MKEYLNTREGKQQNQKKAHVDKIKGAFFENLPVFQFFRVLFSSKLWYNSLARHTCLSRGCDDFYSFYELSYVQQDQ